MICLDRRTLLNVAAILTIGIHPAFASLAFVPETVTASAVVVPAQITKLGFLISAPVREVKVTEGEQVKAGEALIVLDTPELGFEVDAAKAAVRSEQAVAEIQISERLLKYGPGKKLGVIKRWVSVPHEVIEMAEARVQGAQTRVEIAQINLAQGTLIAPQDGIVASIQVIPGEFVRENETILTLATLDALQVKTTDLSERDVSKVKVGALATIFIEALNEKISGRVIGISPIATRVGGDVVFEVTLAPDTQPQGLLWGMMAEVEIQGGE